MTTYAEALGLTGKPSKGDIKKAYAAKARELHPDTNPDAKAQEIFKLVTAAYNALTNDKPVFMDKGYSSWQRQWDELHGIKTRPRSVFDDLFDRTHEEAGDPDLADFIAQMERMRREANRQRAAEEYAKRQEDERLRKMARDAARARMDEEERLNRDAEERAERDRQERREHRHTYGDNQRAEGKCGAFTKSGPCVRPEGHTPNGHMSQAVKDQKYANYKARQGRS